MHEYITFLFFIYLQWKWSAVRLNLIFISVNLKSHKLSQPCNKRSQKLSLLNQPIYSVAPSIQREPGWDVDILKMPANPPSHPPDSQLCAHQRKPITSPHSMCCLSQKLLQGTQKNEEYVLCQHIPLVQCIGEYYSSKFHSFSHETYKSGDTAETAPRWAMFISSERFSA